MTITLKVLLAWDVSALNAAADDVERARLDAHSVVSDLGRVHGRIGEQWEGDAAKAAAAALNSRIRAGERVDQALSMVRRTLRAAHDALYAAQELAQDAKAHADRHGLFMLDDGRCNRPAQPLVANDAPANVQPWYEYRQGVAAAEQAEALAQQALLAAQEADADATAALQQAWDAARDGSTWDAQDRAMVLAVTERAVPEVGTAPEQVAAWWASLAPAAQALLISRQPELIGGMDGVPVHARDRANRARLGASLRLAQQTYADAEAALATAAATAVGRGGQQTLSRLRAIRDDALRELEMLQAVELALGTGSERTLMLLDTELPGRAAIGLGDVDNADHVAVLVPGMNSHVTNYIGRLTLNAERVKDTSSEGLMAIGADQDVAAVAWVGYLAPTIPDVASQAKADAGAPQLASLLNGIEATRAAEGRPLHLTTLGHSYGSVVSGLAAKNYTAMDNLVLFGSPGAGVSHVSELAMPPDRVFVGEARRDIVSDLERFGGKDPAAASFGAVPFQTDGGPHDLGGQTLESTGHSDYYKASSESLWNMVAVVIGQPESVTVGHTFGVGDRLWAK